MSRVEDRLVELESRLLHQERTIELLDEALREHQDRFDALSRAVALLREQLREVGTDEAAGDEAAP